MYACKYAHHKIQIRSYYLILHQATYRPGPIMLHFSPIMLCSNATYYALKFTYYALKFTYYAPVCPIKYSNNDGKLLNRVMMIVNLDVQRKCTMNQYIAW